jgi:hypothetical protein
MTDNFPGPVNADKAEEAEARCNDLRKRFRAVSRGVERRGGRRCGTGGLLFSPFEIAIGIAVALFVLWVAVRTIGLA